MPLNNNTLRCLNNLLKLNIISHYTVLSGGLKLFVVLNDGTRRW